MQIDFNYLNASEVMLSGKRFFYDEQFKLAISIDTYQPHWNCVSMPPISLVCALSSFTFLVEPMLQ